jgi:hypothetical protein
LKLWPVNTILLHYPEDGRRCWKVHTNVHGQKSGIFVPTHTQVGRNSIGGTATRYGLDFAGIESRWRRDFPHPSIPALWPIEPPIQQVPFYFSGG